MNCENLSKIQKEMVQEAMKRHPDAKKLNHCTMEDSFVVYGNKLTFQYNDSKNSTHMIVRYIYER